MKIEHVAYPMPDPVAAAAWYAEHLGFRVVRAMERSPYTHFLLDPDGVVTQNGDSGGPTFWEDADGNRILVAVTAWGSPVPGVDHRYRVDTPDSLAFIDCMIEAVEAGLF